jgi:GTP-binding protein
MSSKLEKIFLKECLFIAGAVTVDQLPCTALKEIGFIGRSNVGKSSLINALVNQTKLARTSNTPGRTKQLNFFKLDDQLILVDMPGFGYAKASKSEILAWNRLISSYLTSRVNLDRIFLLVDSRRGLKEIDLEFMKFLDEYAVKYQIVLTKVDLVSKSHLDMVRQDIESKYLQHPSLLHNIVACSARKKIAITELRYEIANILK